MQLSDITLGQFRVGDENIAALPRVSNMVLVAQPSSQKDRKEEHIDLTNVALQSVINGGGMQLNQRRFAAVKYTSGKSADPFMHRTGLLANMHEKLDPEWDERQSTQNETPCYDFLRGRWIDNTREVNETKRDQRICSESWNRVTVLCFATARLVCTGSKCGWDAVNHALQLTRSMRAVTPSLPNPTCVLQNIVAAVVLYKDFDDRTTDLDGSLLYNEEVLNGTIVENNDKASVLGTRKRRRTNSGAAEGDDDAPGLPLADIAAEIGLQANFNKSLFPGLIVRQQGVCFLVFRRSACVVTGAKSVRQMMQAYVKFLWSFTVHTLRVFERNPDYHHMKEKIPKFLRILVQQQQDAGCLHPMTVP